MSKRIVVNVGLLETRVAVQEGNLLTELYLERSRHHAFLYAGDYTANLADVGRTMLAAADEDVDPDAELDGDEEPKREPAGPIEEMLSRGDTVLVQVSKESLVHAAGPPHRRLPAHP